MGKMRMFIRIYIRILPVATSADPHVRIVALNNFVMKKMSVGYVNGFWLIINLLYLLIQFCEMTSTWCH